MTIIKGPGIGRRFSRNEGLWNILFSLNDKPNQRANIIDLIDYIDQKLVFRTIEAGYGLKIQVVDADDFISVHSPHKKILLSSTLQEGVNIKVDGNIINSVPATTLNFVGVVSAFEISPGEIKISLESNLDVYSSGTKINTQNVKSLNFYGQGVSLVETSGGDIDITITNLINVELSGNPLGQFTTIDFLATSGSVIDGGGGKLIVDLIQNAGIIDMSPKTVTYTGFTVVSGEYIVSGFFGTDNPNPENVFIAINGLILNYNSVSSLSDFDIEGNNLVLKIDNIGYSLDNGDKIQGYYWIKT